MSVSSVSSSTNNYQTLFQQIKKDFSALQTSLSSDNVTDAQSAYATLMKDLQSVQQTQGGDQTAGSSQVSKDLAAVGAALQSGDISTAQSAFTTLTQDLQKAQQTQDGQQQVYKGHHHHGDGSQSTDSTVADDLTAVGSALQSGDISTAQSAFATLLQDLGNSAQNSTGTSGNSLLTAGANVNIAV